MLLVGKLPMGVITFLYNQMELTFTITSILCINTTNTDDIQGSNSYTSKGIAKCSTLSCQSIPPSVLLGDEILNNTYVSRDTHASCRLVPPFILNKHIHPFGISNPTYHCYVNSKVQLLFPILWSNSHVSSLMPVRKVPYQNIYLKQHIVHPVLQMWMPSNVDWYNRIHSTVAKFSRIFRVPYDAKISYQ